MDSLGSNTTKETKLEPNQTETVKLNVTFVNAGLSTAEARVYGMVDDVKYLLNYLSETIFVKEVKSAKLIFDKMVLVNEPDNEINQHDEVKLKIFVKNIGDGGASSVTSVLTSQHNGITVVNPKVNYIYINPKESIAPDYFELRVEDAEVGNYELELKINFVDSLGGHDINLMIPIAISTDFCTSNNQCASNEICSKGICEKISCTGCTYPSNHVCASYECCSNADCLQLYTCDTKLHICKPPQCTSDLQCKDNEICSNEGKCKEAFTLVVVPLGISENNINRYYQYSKEEIEFFKDTSPLKEAKNDKTPLRVHYISPSLCSPDTRCSWQTYSYCYEEISECVEQSGLVGIANKLVAIVGKSIGVCGFAGIGGYSNVNQLGCSATPAHELGHNFELYHIEPETKPILSICSKPSGACIGVNADDCKDPKAYSDIMSYCSPEDHYGPLSYDHMKTKYFSKYLG